MQKLLSKIVLFTLVFNCLIISQSFSQFDSSDRYLIVNTGFVRQADFDRHIQYMFAGSESWIIKYNPISLFLGGLMYLYQQAISPQISASCLYHPSCSRYSILLIREYGILKGIICSADRLTRCNKIAAQDISPVRIDDKTHKVFENVEIYRK